jgi:hypothetical protein
MANNDKQLNYSEIVSIDPTSLKAYRYSKNEIQPSNIDKSKKTSFFTSYIQSKDVISASIELSSNIPDEDLKDAIEIKVYDELGLDSTIGYTITHIEIPTNETKNRTFNVFIIESSIIEQQLSEIRKKTTYIDYVTTAPFLVGSLYKKALLEPEGIDCFIYFQNDDAFLALYSKGEYLYSKSLHYSLTQITEKFCELLGERIDEKDFYKLLTTEGLKSSNVTYQSYLMQLFSEIFLYINDVLIFAKRSYNIDHIDKVYIGSQIGNFIGMDEYAKSYLGLESFEFNFSIAINSKEWYIDQIHILMALSAQLYMDEQNDTLNFSIFKRPPPLKERPVGKVIGVAFISLFLTLIYPVYQFAYTQYLKIDLTSKTQEYNTLSKENNLLKSRLGKLKNEKNRVLALVDKETQKLNFRKKLIKEIRKKKIDYPMKAKILVHLIRILNKYQSTLSQVEFKEGYLIFFVQSPKEKKITEFIKELTQLNRYKITTDKIEHNKEKNLYLSQIAIGIGA